MKKLLLAGAALVALSTAARAADIGVAVAPAPAGFNWTGFYIGGTIGVMNQNTKWQDNLNVLGAPFVPLPVTGNPSAGAMPIGITLGYNWEFNNIGVIGIEADASYFLGGLRSGAPCPNGGAAFECRVRSNWQATIGPRLGVVVMDRGLLYVKGGLAATDIARTAVFNATQVVNDTLSATRLGWFVGVGAEYALANNWSIKFEYTYANYGSWTGTQIAPGGAPLIISRTQTDQHTIKVGFNYLFTTGVAAPVAVRY